MVERTLGHLGHTPKQGVVDVGQLNERYARGEAEHALDEVHQGVGKKELDAAERDEEIAVEA